LLPTVQFADRRSLPDLATDAQIDFGYTTARA
jgi:hypothetical protein